VTTIRPKIGDYVVVLGRDRRHAVRRVIAVATSTFKWMKPGNFGPRSTGISHVLYAGDEETAHALVQYFDESMIQYDKAKGELELARQQRNKAALAAVTRK
jgi:hypothetical protein